MGKIAGSFVGGQERITKLSLSLLEHNTLIPTCVMSFDYFLSSVRLQPLKDGVSLPLYVFRHPCFCAVQS